MASDSFHTPRQRITRARRRLSQTMSGGGVVGDASPVSGLTLDFSGLSTNSPSPNRRITRSSRLSLTPTSPQLDGNNNTSSNHGNYDSPPAMNLRRHSTSHVKQKDLTAAPQKRYRTVARTPRDGAPPASPLTLPEGQEATSPAAKRPRNPSTTTNRAGHATEFSMVLRGSASAAFKPATLETFKTPTSTRRISVTSSSSSAVKVPTFSLSPAARTPVKRAAPSPSGFSRLPEETSPQNAPTTPKTSHTMSRRQTMDAILFKSPLSPAEYSSPVLKRRRNSSGRGFSHSPAHTSTLSAAQGAQGTSFGPNFTISPQNDGSRDGRVSMEIDGAVSPMARKRISRMASPVPFTGAMSPIPFGLMSPDLDKGEMINHSFDDLVSKPITSRRNLFNTTNSANDDKSSPSQQRVPSFKELFDAECNNSSNSSIPKSASTTLLSTPQQRKKTIWRRYHSDSDAIIKSAINRAEAHDGLAGDYSRELSLPTTGGGKHQDLKYVSAETVFKVVTNTFPEQEGNNTSFVLIDCRYPYEFDGGHIPGALNLYTKEMINDFLNDYHTKFLVTKGDDDKNNSAPNTALIFHCEFSSERGPKLARFVRSQDRLLNADKYPQLTFPEIYIAELGYREFYRLYPTLCEPQGYIPMIHDKHSAELRHFRVKSRSWTAGERISPSHGRSRSASRDCKPSSARKLYDTSTPATSFREAGRKLRL